MMTEAKFEASRTEVGEKENTKPEFPLTKAHTILILEGIANYGASAIVFTLAKGIVKVQPNLAKKVAVALALYVIASVVGEKVGKEAVGMYKMYVRIVKRSIDQFKNHK